MKWILRILAILFISVILLLTSLAVIIATVDVNRYKGLIAVAFSKSTGLNLKILGKVAVEREGGLRINVSELEIRDAMGNLFIIDSLFFTMPYEIPGDILKLDSVAVYRPRYVLDNSKAPTKAAPKKKLKSKKKKRKAKAKKTGDGGGSVFQIVIRSIQCDMVSIADGSFAIADTGSNKIVDLRAISVVNGGFIMHLTKSMPAALELSAHALIGSATAFHFRDKKLITQLAMKNNHLSFSEKSNDVPGNSLDLSLDFKGNKIEYQFRGARLNENLSSIYKSIDMDGSIFSGTYNADFDFSYTQDGGEIEPGSISGRIRLTSEDMVLRGVDLDKLIRKYRRTQSFSLKDLGSVLVLGPWGLAISKGSDYAGLAMASSGDSSMIEFLNCAVRFQSNMIYIEDVAFRTAANRMALSGSIDFVNSRYHAFSYALIDKYGCPEIREEFNGNFEAPGEKGTNYMKVLIGPVTNIFKGTSKVVFDKDCKLMYKGVVSAPSTKKDKRSKNEE